MSEVPLYGPLTWCHFQCERGREREATRERETEREREERGERSVCLSLSLSLEGEGERHLVPLPVSEPLLDGLSNFRLHFLRHLFARDDRLREGTLALGGVPREQKMLKGHLPRVIYHQIYWYTKRI